MPPSPRGEDCANLCHNGGMSKKDLPAAAPSEPSPEPPQAPSEPEPKVKSEADLARGLAEMAKFTKLAGHKLLGQLTGIEGIEPDLARAAHDVAFVVNTELAGKMAPEGLARLPFAELAALLQQVASDAPSHDELARQLREKFPEPKRAPSFF